MNDAADGLLAGIRVVDAADEKGELCGRLLAELGADVIRVEPPAGAISRRLPPFAPGGSASLYYALRNANKRGVTLNLETPSGRLLLSRLLDGADVFIESFRPGYLASLGLAPRDLVEQNPRLIVASITDFGQTGPYSGFAGTDMIGFAMGGMMYRAGIPERPPVVAPGALAYDSTGITAAFAVLMAYYQRLQTGRGQHVDVSVMESVANLSDWTMPSYSLAGGYQHRAGSGFVYPVYPCADGYVRMVVLSPREWHALRAWLGEPDALRDDVWDQFMFRITNRDVLDPFITALFSDKTKLDLAREGQSRGLAVTPVLLPGEVIDNEHVASRGAFVTTEVAPGVEAKTPAGFIEIDGERCGFRTRAPSIGEHNVDVYTEELGLPEEDLVTLRAEGVI